jgi:flagellar basal body-associated protein FliL
MSEEAEKTEKGESVGGEKKGGSPLVPILVGVLAGVGTTFGVVKMLVLPQIEKATAKAMEAVAAASGNPDAANAVKHVASSEKAEKKKEEKKKDDGHGGGHGGGKDAKKGPESVKTSDGWTCVFPTVTANLIGTGGSKYLRAAFVVISDSETIAEVVEENKGKLKDEALSILGSRTLADLESPAAKQTLRMELMTRFNRALNSSMVKGIQFTEFLVQ